MYKPHIYSCKVGRGERKVGSTWDLTEERVGVFAKGSSHCRVQTGLAVASGQLRPRVVTTLVVIVLDIKVDQLGEVDAERAARIVDVLAIECLQVNNSWWCVEQSRAEQAARTSADGALPAWPAAR